MDRKLHILQHSLGLDDYGRGKQYRNHFVTGPGSNDYVMCQELVSDGFMTKLKGSELSGGYPVFIVTTDGMNYVKEHSPQPPKLTRSQKRYRDWLNADCGYSFAEWIGAKR